MSLTDQGNFFTTYEQISYNATIRKIVFKSTNAKVHNEQDDLLSRQQLVGSIAGKGLHARAYMPERHEAQSVHLQEHHSSKQEYHEAATETKD